MISTVASAVLALAVASVPDQAGIQNSAGSNMVRRLRTGFEENRGQAPEEVKFLGSIGGHRVFFTSEGVQFTLAKLQPLSPDASDAGTPPDLRESIPDAVAQVGMVFEGRVPEAVVVGDDLLSGKVHHLVGPPSAWRRDIPLYARVRYEGVYPGIDAVFYDAGGWLKYDFLVSPGAEPGKIQLRVDGAEGLRLTEEGELLIETAAGEIRQRRPLVYQEREGAREEVAGSFAVAGNRVAFTVGDYDRSRVLVIDPQIGYSTYVGGSGDDQGFFAGLAVDGEGNAFVSGETNSATGLLSGRTTRDAFVEKIDPKGERLLFLVYLGGSGDDRAFDVFVDGTGSVYLTGTTSSPNFTGADPSGYVSIPPFLVFDTFLVKLTSTGGLVYSRYFGLGSGFAIAADRQGNAYLSSGGSVNKFDPLGGHLATVSFVNEGSTTTRDVQLDAGGNVYATGRHAVTAAALDDVFVARVSADLGSTAFVLLPNSGGQDRGWGLATDGTSNVYVAGETNPDPNLPSQKTEAFVAKLAPDLSLVYLTRLGGSDLDQGRGVAADGSGNLYVTGFTASPDFPTKDPFTPPVTLGSFVMKLKADTSEVVWSTLIGGNRVTGAAAIAVDGSENIYVQGRTSSTTGLIGPGGLQPTYGGGTSDIFLIQIEQERKATIEVLPSTTRWKPQKDTTKNIDVNFQGPKGLQTTSTLQITDPDGALVANPTLTLTPPADPNADPAQYKITWAGPWTTTDSSGNATFFKRGNYRIVVKGVKADGSTIDSKLDDPNATVSLVEVTAIKFVPLAGTPGLKSNPGPGGGSAIFPEAVEPPTTTNQNPQAFDTVPVAATTDPVISDLAGQEPVKVYFRALDVDDPSASGAPVDDENLSADNRTDANAGLFGKGNPAPGALPAAAVGAVLEVQVSTDNPAVSATLRVSPRQGDNYRVAASTSLDWVNGLQALQNKPDGEVRDANGQRLSETKLITEMLTVWRTLHLEVNALASQDPDADQRAMDLRGQQFTMVTRDRLIDRSGAFFTADHPNANDWAGANLSLSFHAGDWYDVTGNQRTVADVRIAPGQLPLHNNLRPPDIMALQDKSYVVRDDEILSLDATKPCGPTNCVADYSLAEQLLAKAYITLEPLVQSQGDATIPFVVTAHRNLTSNFGLANQVLSSRSYWATQLLSAFDGDPAGDLDPRPSTGSFPINLGLTTVGTPINDGRHKLKSTVFLETTRDMYEKPPQGTVGAVPLVLSSEVNKRVTAHEILHAFGLVHDAAIMCAKINIQNNAVGGTITDDHVQQLRSVERPVPAADIDRCP